MNNVDRRLASLIAFLAPLTAGVANADAPGAAKVAAASHDMSSTPASWVRPHEIAMLIYPKMTALDLIGPQYMFASLMGAKVHLVAKTLAPVTSDTGVTILPTKTFADCPKDLTVLFAPGGAQGTLDALQDGETRAFMAEFGARAAYVTSVCTGSLILGAAGLLKGYRATSHWAARNALTQFGAISTDARVVKDRNRITGAGVTAGLDFGLTMIGELRNQTYAEIVQLICEYDPHPPFNSGSLHTARPEIAAITTQMYTKFSKEIDDAVKRVQRD